MAHGGSKGASAFSFSLGPTTSNGMDGEMARVSIASLLENADPSPVVETVGGGVDLVAVGHHGMIADLYASNGLSSVTLDFTAIAPVPAALQGEPTGHDVPGIVATGNVHLPIHEVLATDIPGSALGFFGEQRVADEPLAAGSAQSALGERAISLWQGHGDALAVPGNLYFNLHELPMLTGADGLPAPINDHHIVA